MFVVYSSEGRKMYETPSEADARTWLLEWKDASYIIGTITRTVILLREDCQPCVVSLPKDEPETPK